MTSLHKKNNTRYLIINRHYGILNSTNLNADKKEKSLKFNTQTSIINH